MNQLENGRSDDGSDEAIQYRTQGGGSTHVVGRDGDPFYTLCGVNMHNRSSWVEKGPVPDYALCRRCKAKLERSQ